MLDRSIYVVNCRSVEDMHIKVFFFGCYCAVILCRNQTILWYFRVASAMEEDTYETSYYFSDDVEESVSSECSSLTSFEDQTESQGPTELHGILAASMSGEMSPSGLTTCLANPGRLRKLPLRDRLLYSEFVSDGTYERMNPTNCHPHHKDVELTQFSTLSLQLRNPKCCGVSKTPGADNLFDKCWPLGGLLKNPFSAGQSHSPTHLQVTGYSHKVIDRNSEIEDMDISNFDEVFGSGHSDLEIGTGKMQLESGKHKTPFTAFTHLSWNLGYSYNLLSLNPMLTRNAGYHMTCSSRITNKMDNRKSYIPYFDFSSVEDPRELYGGRFHISPDDEFLVDITDSGVSAAIGVKNPSEQQHDGDEILGDPIDKSAFCTSYSSRNSIELQEESFPTSASGVSKWESLLSSSSKDVNYSAKDVVDGAGGDRHNSMSRFEMPLDVVIDKCIVQEILLQYP